MPFGQDAEDAIIRELEEGEHTTAYISAIIAGERKLTKAIPKLRKSLDSNDNFLKSKCMWALTQLHDEKSYPKIEKIFRETRNPRLVIHGAAALVKIGDPEALKLLLDKSLEQEHSRTGDPGSDLLDRRNRRDRPGNLQDHQKSEKTPAKWPTTSSKIFLDKLSDHPFDPAFKNQIGEFINGKISKTGLISALMKQLAHHHRKIVKIIAGFLKTVDPEQLSVQLIYCILATCRKHGGF